MRRSWLLPVLGLVLALAGGGRASAADELTITRADAAGGQGTIEFAVPAGVVEGIDPATAVSLTENGAPVAGVQVSRVPSNGLEVVLLFDISASMQQGDALGAAKRAASEFLDALPRDVAVGVVAFNDQVSLVAPLGGDRDTTLAAINGLAATGETKLYDALVFAPTLFSGGTNDRQMVLLSDGGDTVSGNTLDAALAVATEIRTSVIELTSTEADAAVLQQVAAAKGGSLAWATDPQALSGLYGDVADDLVNRFRVQFTPAASGSVTYGLRVAVPGEVLEATTVIEVAPPPTTTVPATTLPPTTAPTGEPTTAPTTPSGGGSSSSSGGLSPGVLRAVGLVAVFLATLLLLLLITASSRRPPAPELRARRADALPRRDTRDGLVGRAATMADEMLARRGRASTLADDLEVAGIPLRPGEYLLLAAVGGTVLTLLLASVLPPVLGVVAGVVLTPFVARAVVTARMDQRRSQFVEQLPDLLQTLVSSLRAGYGLPQALDVAASQTVNPTKAELQRVLFEIRIGRDPGDALEAMATRMASPDFTWVVAAMQINREVGGELAVVLENVAETVRERQRLRRQIRVLTAEGRISAYVLTALPFLLSGTLYLTDREYFSPFSDSPGPLLVALGCVLLVIGWTWIRRLVKAQM